MAINGGVGEPTASSKVQSVSTPVDGSQIEYQPSPPRSVPWSECGAAQSGWGLLSPAASSSCLSR